VSSLAKRRKARSSCLITRRSRVQIPPLQLDRRSGPIFRLRVGGLIELGHALDTRARHEARDDLDGVFVHPRKHVGIGVHAGSRSDTTLTGTPAFRASVACVWRRRTSSSTRRISTRRLADVAVESFGSRGEFAGDRADGSCAIVGFLADLLLHFVDQLSVPFEMSLEASHSFSKVSFFRRISPAASTEVAATAPIKHALSEKLSLDHTLGNRDVPMSPSTRRV
jgi:hypothetical protein